MPDDMGIMADVADIRAQLFRALRAFEAMEYGRVWDGDITGIIDPAVRAMNITSIEGAIGRVDKWLTGNWTTDEMVSMLDMISQWDAEVLTERRFQQHGMPLLLLIPSRGQVADNTVPAAPDLSAVPANDIPVWGNPQADQLPSPSSEDAPPPAEPDFSKLPLPRPSTRTSRNTKERE
jgi:hypothetical protein